MTTNTITTWPYRPLENLGLGLQMERGPGGQWIDPRPKHYPRSKDIAVFQRWFGDDFDPQRPGWPRVKATLLRHFGFTPAQCEGMTVLDIVAQLEARDPNAPYMPASWFQSEFGIPPERLRAARRRTTNPLPYIMVENEYRYSVLAAMQRWPADVLYLPGDRPANTG